MEVHIGIPTVWLDWLASANGQTPTRGEVELNISVNGVDISPLAREIVPARIITVSQDTFFCPGSVRLGASAGDHYRF